VEFLKVSIKKHSSEHSFQQSCRDNIEEQVLCRIEDVADGDSKEIELSGDGNFTLCLVRRNTVVHAYRNSCPHTGSPLNWTKDKFLSLDGTMIQCALHGALFRIEDGLCTWGPCLNKNLSPVPIEIRNGYIMLKNE
jgi:nitrite reductase/ring-hydroxylating ferredoxin subunit